MLESNDCSSHWQPRNDLPQTCWKYPLNQTLYSHLEKNQHSRVYVLLIVVYLLVNGGKMVLSMNADQICNENESTLIVDISLVISHLHLLHFAISYVCPLARAKLVVRVIWKKKGNFEDGYTRKAYQSPLNSTEAHACCRIVKRFGLWFHCDFNVTESSKILFYFYWKREIHCVSMLLINLQHLHFADFFR